MSTFPLKTIDLRLVVVVDEGFDSPDRAMVRVPTRERRREPEHPAGQPPNGNKPAAVGSIEDTFHGPQVALLRVHVAKDRRTETLIPRRRQCTAIDLDGSDFAGMV